MTDANHHGPPHTQPHVLGSAALGDVAEYVRARDVRKILVLLGAGASVAAGIPDFRSPGTGLYSQLQKYELEDPADAFSIALLRSHPGIFYSIAKEMNLWPGAFKPTAVHHFVKVLADEGRLLRCCTQNIDGLERAAGVPDDLIVEAHGSFATASCIDCHEPFDIARNRQEAFDGHVSECPLCGGVVKPDVVFFGESLPQRFFDVLFGDTHEAEMVIIIGTSLQVHPFAALPLKVAQTVPRIVFNMERVGGQMFSFPTDPPGLFQSSSTSSERDSRMPSPVPANELADHNDTALHEDGGSLSSSSSSSSSDGYEQYGGDYGAHPVIGRDAFFAGDCQQTVQAFAELLHLSPQLDTAMAHDRL